MIIELFGPPGAGKTTFAHALAARLQESGHIVEPVLSYRPVERSLAHGGCVPDSTQSTAAVLRRLSLPAIEILAMMLHPSTLSNHIGIAASIMRTLPAKNLILSVKFSQYILRLAHAWHNASVVGRIVVFDQAFIQLVCSLALLGRIADETLIMRTLDLIPNSDLLIRLDAPHELLKARLCDRQFRQRPIERLLEIDMHTNLNSICIIDQVHDLLRKRRQSVICASSLDRQSLCKSVEVVEQEFVARFGVESRATA